MAAQGLGAEAKDFAGLTSELWKWFIAIDVYKEQRHLRGAQHISDKAPDKAGAIFASDAIKTAKS